MKAIIENNDCFTEFAVSIFDYSLGNEEVLHFLSHNNEF